MIREDTKRENHPVNRTPNKHLLNPPLLLLNSPYMKYYVKTEAAAMGGHATRLSKFLENMSDAVPLFVYVIRPIKRKSSEVSGRIPPTF